MARTPYVKDLMDSLRQHASNEVRTQVSRALPPGVSLPASVPSNQHGPALALARPNPSRGRVIEAEFEHDEEEQESGGDDHSLFMFFSYPDRERNLASAAAAYRAAGEPPEYDDDDNVVVDGDLIAQHTDLGTAFFGNAAQLQLYIERTDTKPDDWEVWDEPDEILELDFDTDALVRVVRLMDEQQDAFKAAQEEYTKFHWGDRSQGVGMVEIPAPHRARPLPPRRVRRLQAGRVAGVLPRARRGVGHLSDDLRPRPPRPQRPLPRLRRARRPDAH